MKAWEEMYRRGDRMRDFDRRDVQPELEKTSTILQVMITEKQWEAVKKNVLEVF